MKIELLLFGQIRDIVGDFHLDMEFSGDTDNLRKELLHRFPSLKGVKFALALDNKLVAGNQVIPAHCKVAVMPPFSGG